MLTRLYLVSGDGIGAGKTTFADRLGAQRRSLAGAMRDELGRLYPAYDWWNRTQEYKANTHVPEAGNRTVREVLLEYGQLKCRDNPAYWAERLATDIGFALAAAVVVDDVRKRVEVLTLRAAFPLATVLHFHIHNPSAQTEPEFEATALRDLADYVVSWRPDDRRHSYLLHGDAQAGAGGSPAPGAGGVAACRCADSADAGWGGQVPGGALPGQLGWQRHPLYPDERPGAAVPRHLGGSPDDPEWYAPWLSGG